MSKSSHLNLLDYPKSDISMWNSTQQPDYRWPTKFPFKGGSARTLGLWRDARCHPSLLLKGVPSGKSCLRDSGHKHSHIWSIKKKCKHEIKAEILLRYIRNYKNGEDEPSRKPKPFLSSLLESRGRGSF